MKKKPKSIRIAEWNKTMKYIQSRIEAVNKLHTVAVSNNVDADCLDQLAGDLHYWENQRSAHISTKPI